MIYAKSGTRGHNAEMWQRNINKVASKIGLSPSLKVDGIFGSKSVKGAILLQRYLGVKADGIIGSGTLAAWKKKFPYLSTGVLPTTVDKTTKKIFNTASKERIKQGSIITTSKPKPVYQPKPTFPKPVFRAPWVPPPFIPQPKKAPVEKKAGAALPIALIGGALLMAKMG